MKDWKYHCGVLGVRESASAKEVRRAYRRLALERHPDKHNGSTRAKEEFQQLVESYNFLIEGIVEGRRPTPAPATPPPAQARPAPPPFHAPAARLSGADKPWMVWVHAAILGGVLLAGSVAYELLGRSGGSARRDTRDLSQQALCQVRSPGAKDFLGFDTESACRGRCLAQAHASNCTWGGALLTDAKAEPAPPPAAPPPTKAEAAPEPVGAPVGPCRVSTKLTEKLVKDYEERTISMSSCRMFCNQVMDQSSSSGVRCEWGAEVLTDRALRPVSPEDARPWTPPSAAPPDDTPPITVGEAATSCFMTVLVPGNPVTLNLPHETPNSCDEHCSDEMRKQRHAEVHCYYAGREINRRIPDPTQVYLEENPEARGLLNQGEHLGMCLVTGSAPSSFGSVDLVRAATEAAECQAICGKQMRFAPRTTKITCTFEGRSFSP